MEGFIFILLLIILAVKIFAIFDTKSVKKTFLIASGAEMIYLWIGLISNYSMSATILHLEYQFVFRVLAFLLLINFTMRAKSSNLFDLKGVGWGIWGVIFGFAIFGSLGVSLITSKQLILNAFTQSGFFELGYILVAVNVAQAFYLITLFENIVMKRRENSTGCIKFALPVSLFLVLGILVFVYPELYLMLPKLIYPIETFHLDFNFSLYGIGGIFTLLFLFIMLMSFVYSFDYIKENKLFYYLCLVVLTFALVEIVNSSKFENFYFFWEIMTISSYLLIMYKRDERSIKAAKVYLLMCIAGAYVLQLAFSTYFAQGVFSFAEVKNINLSIAILMLIGFGVKAGIFPMHSWLPIAHPEAPSPISAPLSGVLTKAGLFGIIVILFLLRLDFAIFSYLLIGFGLATLFYGEIRTLFEKDVKKLLAYSTIGQIGEIVTIFGIGTSLALSASLYHIINHAIVKDLLFLSAGVLIAASGSRNLDDLKGIGKSLKVASFPLGIGIFAICALPPFGNFNSKFLMIFSAIEENNFFVAFLMVTASIVGFIAMLRLFRYIFLLNPANEFKQVSRSRVAITYILASVSVLLGIFGASVMGFIKDAVIYSTGTTFSLPAFDLSLPLSVMILVIGSTIVFFFVKTAKNAGIIAAVISSIALFTLLSQKDSFSHFFAILVTFMAILNFVYASKYMDHSHKPNRFFANFMIMIAGILGAVLSENIYSMFFYWEIMGGWALYIALVHEEDSYSIKEATKYLIYNYAGAGVLMIALSIIGRYGFDIGIIKTISLTNTVKFGILLLTIGFLAKAAQFPIRIDYQMHPKPAPTPISGYISSVMLKTGPFMLAKVFFLIGAGAVMFRIAKIDEIAHFAAIIGTVTIIMGAAFGLMTNSMKRLLIFLTVAEIGYIVTGVSLLTSEGFAGGMLHFVNHMFFKDLLFLSAGAIFYKTGVDSLNEIGGLARKMPITFIAFLVAVFATAGVPMFSGFVSKWIIYHALMSKGYIFLAIFTLLGSIMILLVFVKFLHSAYFGKLDKKYENIQEVDACMSIPMVILAALSVVLGIFPSLMLKPINLILISFGFEPLQFVYSLISVGNDTLDLLSVSFYLILAAVIGKFLYLFKVKERKTHIFLSGVRDLSKKELHIDSQNFYETVVEMIEKVIVAIKRVFAIKGGYIER